MKRKGNLYSRIASFDNLTKAEHKARKGKLSQPGVKKFDKNPAANLLLLHEMLINKQYKTSNYTVFKVYEPKERDVYRLPYFPDRITHHAVMNVLEPLFISVFTTDSYSCIKGKGIHGASNALRKALLNQEETKYCLKLDVKKFYENVDHTILKQLLRRKIKDQDLLWLLDEIIDSAPGLPIGNYLSQYFANFYLSYFDHWLKEVKGVKHYFRYCDDLVILGPDKAKLHTLRSEIGHYLSINLKLSVKQNYQVFPVAARGIDFVGYVHYHSHVLLRKSIKQNLARAVAKNPNSLSVPSYYGWAKHCNSKNLLKKLCMTKFSELGIKPKRDIIEGNRIDIMEVMGKEIKIQKFKIGPSKYERKGRSNGPCQRLDLQIEVDGQKRYTWTTSDNLISTIQEVPADKFPIITTIVKQDRAFIFT